MTQPPQLFHYRIAAPSPRVFPGSHPGRMVASGQLFQRHEPLIASPDLGGRPATCGVPKTGHDLPFIHRRF